MFKPMLASPVDLDKLKYPVLASPKLDGVRAVVKDGVVLSRSLKPIPNQRVQRLYGGLEHFDGELIVGEPTSPTVYRDTVSAVMRHDGSPKVDFHVFDHIEMPHNRYLARRPTAAARNFTAGIIEVDQLLIPGEKQLLLLEEKYLNAGYEGLILRDPEAPYKFGRSTTKEGYLLKLKRFSDAEFEIVGFEERQHNGNEATTNELGRTKRSSHKENKTGRGDLGALVLKHPAGTFNCGTGFDDALRATIWNNRDKYLGQLAKVKFFAIGMKDLPRHPTYLGLRDARDL